MIDFDQIERKEVATMTTNTVNIRYRTCEGCERCKVDAYVPHYNCLYQGRAVGHSQAHLAVANYQREVEKAFGQKKEVK